MLEDVGDWPIVPEASRNAHQLKNIKLANTAVRIILMGSLRFDFAHKNHVKKYGQKIIAISTPHHFLYQDLLFLLIERRLSGQLIKVWTHKTRR